MTDHITIQARRLAEHITGRFEHRSETLWRLVADDLTRDPDRLDALAVEAGLPYPVTGDYASRTIGMVRSAGLAGPTTTTLWSHTDGDGDRLTLLGLSGREDGQRFSLVLTTADGEFERDVFLSPDDLVTIGGTFVAVGLTVGGDVR